MHDQFSCMHGAASTGNGEVGATNSTTGDTSCPVPQPFVRNSNSGIAELRSDDFNGTQPEDGGNYTCFSNGIPRATVEIIVLGKHTTLPFRYLFELFSLDIAVPAETSSVNKAYFRFTLLDLTQFFGDQLVVSNCIQSLSLSVR